MRGNSNFTLITEFIRMRLTPGLRKDAFTGFALSALFLLGGCVNGTTISKAKLTQALSLSTLAPTTSSALGLTQVIRDKTYPGAMLDLLGDGSGAFGRYCTTTNTSTALGQDTSQGPTNCKCVYSFDQPALDPSTGGTIPQKNKSGLYIDKSGALCADQTAECSVVTYPKVVEADTNYHENNLVRCNYNDPDQVPATIQDIKVTLRHIPSKTESAPRAFSFVALGTTADYSNPQNYLQVMHHQCRDAIMIENFMSGSISKNGVIDTFLSNDPGLSFPLNFYTTNMGYTIDRFSLVTPSSGAGWLCDFKSPEAGANGTTSGLKNSWGVDNSDNIDFRLFSSTPVLCGSDGSTPPCSTGDGHQIFPATAGFFNRVSFKLSARALGVFKKPLNAYMAPQTLTSSVTDGSAATKTTPNPLGYGVQAIRTVTGERCPRPSEVVIPVKHKWVKLWLFRASIPTRQVYTSQRIPKYLPGGIACNPGVWPNQQPIVADCAPTAANTTEGFNNSKLASRVLFYQPGQVSTAVCLGLPNVCTTPGNVGIGCATGSTDAYKNYQDGTDIYALTNPKGNGGTAADGTADPFDLSYTMQKTRPHGSAPGAVIQDNKSSTFKTIDLDPTGSRSDYVFVVSPETVMGDDMRAGYDDALPYIPYRFKRAGSCPFINPEASLDSDPDCAEANRIRYSPKKYDMSVSDETSLQGDPVFPMCVLQEVP